MEIFIVSWEQDRVNQISQSMQDKGWVVRHESEEGRRAYQTIKSWMPALVVIDLETRASHGMAVAHSLTKTRSTRDMPIVFVTEDPAQIRMLAARFEDADFVGIARVAEFIDDEYEVA